MAPLPPRLGNPESAIEYLRWVGFILFGSQTEMIPKSLVCVEADPVRLASAFRKTKERDAAGATEREGMSVQVIERQGKAEFPYQSEILVKLVQVR